LALYLDSGGDAQVRELSDVVDEKLIVDKSTKKKKSKKPKKKPSEDEEEEEEDNEPEPDEDSEDEKPKKPKSKSKSTSKKPEKRVAQPDDGMEDLLGIAAAPTNPSQPKPSTAPSSDPFQGLFS
jgi:hypothetical protein